MHIDEVKRYQAEKDHLMRNEGKHPANYSNQEKESIFPKEAIPYDHIA